MCHLDHIVDPKKPTQGQSGNSSSPGPDNELTPNAADEFFKRLQSDMRRPAPGQDAVSAAFQTMQRIAAESSGNTGMEAFAGGKQLSGTTTCEVCGHQNRVGNQFCGMCGLPLGGELSSPPPESTPSSASGPGSVPSRAEGPHHYHHHYHHHFFSSSPDFSLGSGATPRAADTALKDTAKLRSSAPGQVMSRNEIAVRKVTHDWAAACNTKQLDDLVTIYATDALVLRPNHGAVRGSAAIREFFFAALDAGLGEVELEPLRVEIYGDVAYEAGRCKMLVPYVVGKRREERGKYLTVLARQPNGEWRIVSDCWSTDLSLSPAIEADSAKPAPSSASPVQKPPLPRKGP
jgi:ketosteroid isomerase-like protein